MYGTAIDNGEILTNRPNAYNFVLTGGVVDTSKTLWLGPDIQVAQPVAPLLHQDGLTNRWSTVLRPTAPGDWTLLIRDSANNVLHQAHFRAVYTYSWLAAMGLTRTHEGLIRYFPALCTTLAGAVSVATSNFGGASRMLFLSSGKYVIPYNCGRVFGLELFTPSALAAATDIDIRFVTYNPLTQRIRGISENLKARAGIAWNSNNYTMIEFVKAPPAEPGDWIGFWVDDSANNGATACFQRVDINATSGGQVNRARTDLTSVDLANPIVVNGVGGAAEPTFVNMRLLLHAPIIGIFGHGHAAGFPSSTPVSSSTNTGTAAFVAESDPGVMLSRRLGGVPCVAMGWAGTTIQNWLRGANSTDTVAGQPCGLMQKLNNGAFGLRCAYLFGYTAQSDANNGWCQSNNPGFTSEDYLQRLIWLDALAKRSGAELHFIEDLQTRGTVTANTAVGGRNWSEQINVANQIIEAFCSRRNRIYVPINDVTGEYSGVRGEHVSERYQLNQAATNQSQSALPDREDVPDYRDTGGSGLNNDGRGAVVDAVAFAVLRGTQDYSRRRKVSHLPALLHPLSNDALLRK